MSFFIRKQRRNNEGGSRLSSRAVPKKRRIEKVEEEKPEEITSEEEDEEDSLSSEEDESEHETEQEARVRIAKREIASLREKLEQNNDVVDDDLLGDSLKQSVLATQGKVIRKHVAEEFSNNIKAPIVACSSAKALKSPLTCMVVDEVGIVYTSSKNGCVIKWEDPRKCKFVKPSPVYCLALGKSVLAGSTKSSILLMSLSNLETLHKLTTRDAGKVSIMNDTIFSTHKDRTVKVWNISEHAYVESLFGHQDTPTDVDCVDGEDLRAVSCGGFDKTIRVWKINEESQLVFNWDQHIIDVVKTINSVLFVAGTCSGAIGLFSFNRKKPLFVVNQAHGVDGNGVPRWITALGVLRNSDLIASGSDCGGVKIWKIGVKNIQLLNTVQVGKSVVVSLQFIQNQTRINLFAALGVEHSNGRWAGRVANKNTIVRIS